MRIWGKAEERGALLGAIGAIVLLTFIFPDPDVDLGVSYPGNPPYGTLWFLLNPFFWTKRLYPMIVFAEWSLVTLIEWWALPQNRGLVKLQIMSTAFLFAIHAIQDVTVIMFAPLVVFFLPFLMFEIFQKIPAYGTPQWTCAFGGNSTAINVYSNPCLSTGTKFFIFSPHVYSLTYILLVFWAIYPLVIWWKTRARAGRLRGAGGGQNKKCDDYCVCKDCEDCEYAAQGLHKFCCQESEDVERGGIAENKYSLTPTIPTQPAISLPTKIWNRNKPESFINPFEQKPLKEGKRYVKCSNCGEAIPEKLIVHHYKFCAMTTPPSQQPFRENENE